MGMALEHRKVLVLNKSWAAINVVPLKRAFGLIFSWHSEIIENGKIIHPSEPKARILDTSDYNLYTWNTWSQLIPKEGDETINSTFKLPEIVILSRYNKLPQQKVHFNRRTIYKRDNFRCQYCGEKVSSENGSLDHVIPKSQSGCTSWHNIVLCCTFCNSQKRNRRPEEAFKDRKNWKGPSPMRLINGPPQKPKYDLFKGDRMAICKSWQDFLSETYWLVDLQNDMNE